MRPSELSHLDQNGEARMVDVGWKISSDRMAEVTCQVLMKPETLALLRAGKLKKGDAFTAAKIAGMMAAKKTSDLIPMCHPIPVDGIQIDFLDRQQGDGISITARVTAHAKTGVEMEALCAASMAALTIYDMAKAVDPGMIVTDLKLVRKTGGKSDYSIQYKEEGGPGL